MDIFSEKFKKLNQSGEIAFMPFLVAGFPDFKTSLEIAKTLSQKADFLEIGFPYSDPLADGPVIQSADVIALRNGMSSKNAFRLIKQLHKFSAVPITIMVYANVVCQFGIQNFYSEAKKSGASGVLIPDVPVEESAPFVAAAHKASVVPVFMVSPTTNKQRLEKILKFASGYLYVVSVLGVTGVRKKTAVESLNLIKFLKTQTNLPLAVGFGISDKRQIKNLKSAGADGAIIGSSLVSLIAESKNQSDAVQKIKRYLNDI